MNPDRLSEAVKEARSLKSFPVTLKILGLEEELGEIDIEGLDFVDVRLLLGRFFIALGQEFLEAFQENVLDVSEITIPASMFEDYLAEDTEPDITRLLAINEFNRMKKAYMHKHNISHESLRDRQNPGG